MGLASRIKERREQIGMTRKELADFMGITASAVANYENEISSPKAELLYPLMEALRCDANYLYQDETDALGGSPMDLLYAESEHIKKYRSLDQYGQEAVDSVLDVEYRRMEAMKSAQSSSQTEVSSEIIPEPAKVIPLFTSAAAAGIASPVLGEDYEDYVLTKDDPQKAILAVRVQGDSMEPHFPDGSIVFCDKTPLQIGDIGVFILDGGSLLKQWCVDNYGNAYLFSLNRKRADADVTVRHSSGQTLTCMGRVITHNRFPLPV